MKLARLHTLAAVSVLLTGCAAKADPAQSPAPEVAHKLDPHRPDDQAERIAIFEKVETAIKGEDLAGLNRMEQEYRTSKARMPSGLWKLMVFHQSLQFQLAEGIVPKEGCKSANLPFVERWKAFDPAAPAPVITEAEIYKSIAWCYRGDAFAGSVTDNGWAGFHDNIAKAAQALEASRPAASVDPEYYAILVDISRAQSEGRDKLDILINEATSREPSYQNFYFHAAWSFMPQWGGSEAEFDRFARFAAARTAATDKTGMYARIYWKFEDCHCDMIRRAGDWDMMKLSMRDIWSQYPSIHNGIFFQKITCRMGDNEEGLHYLRALAPEARSDADLVARIEACKNERLQAS